jgi:Chromo (CHRromatin Organisation MOdifier) domain
MHLSTICSHLAQVKSPTTYEVNDYVLEDATYKSELKRAAEGKLHCRWNGPFQVISRSEDKSRYVVKDIVNNKEHAVHVKHLKPFLYDPEFTDPYTVALKDTESWVVEKIMGMKGKFAQKRSSSNPLKFQVRWKGFSPAHDTWEPWANLRYNVVLHQWMTENGYAKFIPKQSLPTDEDTEAHNDDEESEEELIALNEVYADYMVLLHNRIADYKP